MTYHPSLASGKDEGLDGIITSIKWGSCGLEWARKSNSLGPKPVDDICLWSPARGVNESRLSPDIDAIRSVSSNTVVFPTNTSKRSGHNADGTR